MFFAPECDWTATVVRKKCCWYINTTVVRKNTRKILEKYYKILQKTKILGLLKYSEKLLKVVCID